MSNTIRSAIISGLTAVACIIMLIPGITIAGPEIEKWLAPIETAEIVSNIRWDDNHLCWEVEGTKLREAILLSTRWSIVYNEGQQVGLVVTRNGEIPSPGSQVSKGQSYSFDFCTQIPPIPGSLLAGHPATISEQFPNAVIRRTRIYDTGTPWHVVIIGPTIQIPPK